MGMGVGVPGLAPINVNGGDASDIVRFSGSDGGEAIQVVANGTEVSTVAPGTARLDTTAVESLVVLGLGGQDTITSTGNLAALTSLTLDGGEHGDFLSGGNGADLLLGGGGDDFLDGQQGADQAFLGEGDDRFQWDPGDANDVVEGQAGNDLLDFNGSSIGEAIDVSANGGRVRFTRNIASIVMDLDDVEHIGFDAFGGPDLITVNDLTGTDATTVDVDLSAAGGGGDAAVDTVTARGTAGADAAAISGNGVQAVLGGLAAQTRVFGGEEQDEVTLATLAGEDTVSMGMGVPGLAPINVDGGDAADVVRFSGSAAPDDLQVVANGSEVSTVAPATARLDISAVESLVLLGLGGQDAISAVGNLAALTSLTLDGGENGDFLSGGNGADLLLGGGGDDYVDGNQGADQALLGDGDDHFQWDPGDSNDVVEGQAGEDTLDFNGSNIGEAIDVSANGGRVRFTRNIASIVMDLDDVEHLGFDAFGGADLVTVNDLTGTDATSVDVDLSAGGGGGDLQPDTVIVNGTGGADVVDVTRSGSQVLTTGLAAETRIVGSEAAGDTLRIQTVGGDDEVTVAPDVNELLTTIVDLGDDE
jgi:predicted ester cyclase